MVYLISAVLFAAATWFVAYPLFKTQTGDEAGDRDNQLPWERQQAIRSMREELEMDLAMGNISEDEYQELLSKAQDSLPNHRQ